MPDARDSVLIFREFHCRRDGMIHAMDGGLWLHRHVWFGTAMAHLVSTNRELLLAWGRAAGLPARRLQHKPLKDPRTSHRKDAWHWDLAGRFLPPLSGDEPGGAGTTGMESAYAVNEALDAAPPPLPWRAVGLRSR